MVTQLDVSRVVLAISLNVASAFDYWSTKKALDKGLKEGNPIAKTIMKMGWKKYQLTKFTVPVVWAYMGVASQDPDQIWKISMFLGTFVFLSVVMNNILLMRRY